MKLTKHAWLLWTITLILVIVLSVVIPFAKTLTYFITCLATLAMFGMAAYAFKLSFRQGDTLESKLLGWPIFRAALGTLTVQVIVHFVLLACAGFCPWIVAALVEMVILCVAAFALTVKDAAREVVTSSEAHVADHTAAWKAIRARAAAIAAETGHPDIKKLAEEIRYADPTPTSMDGDIAQMLETLSSYADAANIRKATAMLAQRKALAKEEK